MEKKNDKWWKDSDWSPPAERTTRSAGTRTSPRHANKRVSRRKLRLSAGSTDDPSTRPDATFDKISEDSSAVVTRKKVDTTSEFELSESEDEGHAKVITDPKVNIEDI